MTRSSLAVTAAAALLVAISGAAFAQSVGGGSPSNSNAGGALITPKSDPNGVSGGMPAQSDQGSGAPTKLGTGAAPSALTLPGVDKMTPAQIQARLQSNGFQNIRNFTKQADGYSATATKDGQPVKLIIEASSGRVITTNN